MMKTPVLLLALLFGLIACIGSVEAKPKSARNVIYVSDGVGTLPKAPRHYKPAVIVDDAELAKYHPAPAVPAVAPVAVPLPTPVVQVAATPVVIEDAPVQEEHVNEPPPEAAIPTDIDSATVLPDSDVVYALNLTAISEKEERSQNQELQVAIKEAVEGSEEFVPEPEPVVELHGPRQAIEETPVPEVPEAAPEAAVVPPVLPDNAAMPMPENIPPPEVLQAEAAAAAAVAPAELTPLDAAVVQAEAASVGFQPPAETEKPEINEPEQIYTEAPSVVPAAGADALNATMKSFIALAHQVEAESGASLAARFIAAARSKIGKPYARGGMGPNSFDCSGLVNWAAKQIGGVKGMPRTADQLSKFGKAVTSVAARQPGDLIFFGKKGQRVYHVGIYVGPNQMINAPHTGAFVRQENFSYWPDKLTVARRIF